MPFALKAEPWPGTDGLRHSSIVRSDGLSPRWGWDDDFARILVQGLTSLAIDCRPCRGFACHELRISVLFAQSLGYWPAGWQALAGV